MRRTKKAMADFLARFPEKNRAELRKMFIDLLNVLSDDLDETDYPLTRLGDFIHALEKQWRAK